MCAQKSSGESGKCLGGGQRTLHGFPYVLKVNGGGRCGQDKELKVCPVFRRYLTSQVCSPGPGEVTKIYEMPESPSCLAGDS